MIRQKRNFLYTQILCQRCYPGNMVCVIVDSGHKRHPEPGLHPVGDSAGILLNDAIVNTGELNMLRGFEMFDVQEDEVHQWKDSIEGCRGSKTGGIQGNMKTILLQ